MGKRDYDYDFYRFYGRNKRSLKEKIWQPLELKYMYYFRKCQNSRGLLSAYYKARLYHLSHITHIEMDPRMSLGKGFRIMHSGGVIVNSGKIGENIDISPGVTIGAEIRGKRAGRPTIGNYCWIGKNAVIVGNVNIGNDVLIAANAYVNFDVPDHSIVIGNPGRIIHRENATEGYIYNVLKDDDC
ncbi:MAG: serine acetyltransferase [Eubacteriales bacterium]|nr:serine acetyltransferase [Eubacteriales bacterium]